MHVSLLCPFRAGTLALCLAGVAAAQSKGAVDVMNLTDQPGSWFTSELTAMPLSLAKAGERVDFKIGNSCMGTRHMVALLVRPEGSLLTLDQARSHGGGLAVTFDVPGVYLFVCRTHPYMTAVVGVLDAQGKIPAVTSSALPFLEHLGAASLPASDFLDLITTIAPDDATKVMKWDLRKESDEVLPPVPGVGEIWVGTQFEHVPGQMDVFGVEKPGTLTVIDAATFRIEREIGGLAQGGRWNNPHNLWSDRASSQVYNGNWFGRWVHRIDRASGQFATSVAVEEAPAHVVTFPVAEPDQDAWTGPRIADDDLVEVGDRPEGLHVVDDVHAGIGKYHPHGHWLACGTCVHVVVPNVFKGAGVGGSLRLRDTGSGNILAELGHDATDPRLAALLMPIAVGERRVDEAIVYVAHAASGIVTALDVDSLEIRAQIPVTLTPDGRAGFDLFHTLQIPMQTPVSPDGRWVATTVLSLTTVPCSTTGSPDHVALIDTRTNQLVKHIATPAGTHGLEWGAKQGGGYYAYVTSQHSNVLTVIDPDPNGDGNGSDAGAVGTILLANGSPGAGITDGTGGQAVRPLPMTHDGWIQETVALSGTSELSKEVESWLALLTPSQRDPSKRAPRVACTAETSSLGCSPPIGAAGVPSVTSGAGFDLRATPVLDTVTGFLLYSADRRDPSLIPGRAVRASKALELTLEP